MSVGAGASSSRPKALAARLLGGPGRMLFGFTIATMILRLGGNIVLTRLLSPEAFGVVGVITSTMIILAMLSDLGVFDFVIRHERGGERRFLDVVWSIRLGQGGLQAAAMLAGAWPIALVLGKPELAWPIAATAPLFLINALCPISLLLAQRQGRIKASCSVELAALGVQVASNLALSLLMPDYRSLIIGLYVSGVARMLFTMAMLGGRMQFAWDGRLAREFFGFSRWIMASTIVTLLMTQFDKMLFARLFTVADFGVYMLPANLAVAFQPFGRNYVERHFFPLVSRTWQDAPDQLRSIFYAARRRQYLVLFAGIGFGIGVAPALFRLLFDHRYEYGWIYLSVLLLRIAFDLDSFTNLQTLLAIGHARVMFYANLLRLAVFLLLVAATFGLLGPIALPLALAGGELAGLVYTLPLIARHGLFDARDHILYYAALTLAVLVGAAISWIAAPQVVEAGLRLIG